MVGGSVNSYLALICTSTRLSTAYVQTLESPGIWDVVDLEF